LTQAVLFEQRAESVVRMADQRTGVGSPDGKAAGGRTTVVVDPRLDVLLLQTGDG